MPARDRQRRVVVVNHDATRSGAPIVGGEIANALCGDDWDTTLVFRWWNAGPGTLGGSAARLIREPAAPVRVGLQRLGLRPVARVIARRSIRSLLRRFQPDLVWCNSVMTAEYAMVATSMGIPTVLHSHERAEDVAAALGNTGFMAAGTVNSPLLTLVACATGTAEVFARELDLPSGRVQVLHSAVDLDEVLAIATTSPSPRSTAPLVVACGTGNERKGVDVFGQAATESRAAGDATSWVWVGDVPADHRVAAVEYAGAQPSAAPWLAAADVVAVPSRFEQLSLVVIESMALGTPVVASDVSGPSELLGDTGVLVPAGDAAALRLAVDDLLSDPVRAADLASRARERCRERWDLPRFQERARTIATSAASLAETGQSGGKVR